MIDLESSDRYRLDRREKDLEFDDIREIHGSGHDGIGEVPGIISPSTSSEICRPCVRITGHVDDSICHRGYIR